MFNEFPSFNALTDSRMPSCLLVWKARAVHDSSVWLEVCDRSVRLALARGGVVRIGARFELAPLNTADPAQYKKPEILFDGVISDSLTDQKANIGTLKQLERLVLMAQSFAQEGQRVLSLNGEELADMRAHTKTELHASRELEKIAQLSIQLLGGEAQADVVSFSHAKAVKGASP